MESYSFMKEIIIFYMPLEPVVALAFMFFYIKSEACNNNIRDCYDYYAALRPSEKSQGIKQVIAN